jgi:hypothetical protein
MDLLDRLAFLGRKLEKQAVPGTARTQFTLREVMQLFDRNSILELTPYPKNQPGPTIRPDSVRKLKVSLLDDGFSAIHTDETDWFEVFRTAPSGDLSRVRILAHDRGGAQLGEVRMLVGRRSYEHYFEQDPIFERIAQRR